MARFADNPAGYSEQILNMRKDGKTYQEIKDYFRKQYSIKIYDNHIANAKETAFAEALPAPEKKKAARGRKRIIVSAAAPTPAATESEFALHIHAAFRIHARDFVPRVSKELERLFATTTERR